MMSIDKNDGPCDPQQKCYCQPADYDRLFEDNSELNNSKARKQFMDELAKIVEKDDMELLTMWPSKKKPDLTTNLDSSKTNEEIDNSNSVKIR